MSGFQVAQLQVGFYHSIAIMTNGKVYGWGANKEFILGSGGINEISMKDIENKHYYVPVELSANSSISVKIFLVNAFSRQSLVVF